MDILEVPNKGFFYNFFEFLITPPVCSPTKIAILSLPSIIFGIYYYFSLKNTESTGKSIYENNNTTHGAKEVVFCLLSANAAYVFGFLYYYNDPNVILNTLERARILQLIFFVFLIASVISAFLTQTLRDILDWLISIWGTISLLLFTVSIGCMLLLDSYYLCFYVVFSVALIATLYYIITIYMDFASIYGNKKSSKEN